MLANCCERQTDLIEDSVGKRLETLCTPIAITHTHDTTHGSSDEQRTSAYWTQHSFTLAARLHGHLLLQVQI